MSETKQQDLTRMLGVWVTDGMGIIVARDANAKQDAEPVRGAALAYTHGWGENGHFAGLERRGNPYDLGEKLGGLDDLRRGADVLMQRREYASASVLYQLLCDDEGVERAVAKRREQIELERQADADRPF